MIKAFQLIIFISAIASCGESQKETEKDKYQIRQEKQNDLDTLNTNEAKRVSKTFNAVSNWDTTNYYTYSLQELFESDTRPVSFIGEIKDIIKKDSVFILKVVNTNSIISKNFIAEIIVNASLFKTLKQKLSLRERNEGCFIFQVIKITSHLPILKSEVESNGNNGEDASSHLTLDFDESLVKIQGRLLGYYLYEHLKDDDK